jgi:hypothetical protein
MAEEKVYTIGKGKLLFKAAGQANFADLGNCPDFKVSTNVTKKDHFSSREGTKTKDKTIVIEQTALGSFTLDDLLDENLKMFIMSNAITDVVQGSGTQAPSQNITSELDKWIEIGKRKLSSVVVKNDADAITYVLGTDYLLDTEAGLIMPLSTGDIAEDDVIHLAYTYAAITVKRLDAAKVSTIEGHVYFIGNPPSGKILEVKGYVALTPKGDVSLIGEDYINLQFEMEFLSGYGYNGLFEKYVAGVR